MHELSVAGAIIATAVRHADGRPVAVVAVRVGRLRQVVPDSLRFYFEIVAREGPCEGASLELTEVELRLRCDGCGREWEPADPIFRCPRCASTDVEVIAGEELEVEWIEVDDPPLGGTGEHEEATCTAPA
jgi:hydrogenase nickel incorporation protein HypA/HybF